MSITETPVVSLDKVRETKTDDDAPVLTGKERRESERAIAYWEKRSKSSAAAPPSPLSISPI